MKEERLNVEVFDADGNLIDNFDMPVEPTPFYVTFPDTPPYHGLKFYVSSHLNDEKERIYSFSPDGYEYWVRFSQKMTGVTKEYLLDKSYTFKFHTYIKD